MDGLFPITLQEQSTYSPYGVETFKLFWRFDEDRILELSGSDRVFSSGIVGRGKPSRADKWQVHITQSPVRAVPKNNPHCTYSPSALLRLEAIDEPLVRVLEWEYRSTRYVPRENGGREEGEIHIYYGNTKRDNLLYTPFQFRPATRPLYGNRQRENVHYELTVVVEYAPVAMYGNSCSAIRTLRESNVLTDAILVPRAGSGIPVHRVVISAQSQFFYAALSVNGSNYSTEKIMILMDVDSSVLNVFVRVIYGDCLDELPTEMLQNVYVVARKYEAGCIEQQAKETLLKRKLELEKVISFYIFAKRHGEIDLQTKALKSVIAHREKFFMNGGLDEIDGRDKDVFEDFAEDFANDVRLSSIFKEFSEAELFSTCKTYENFKDPLYLNFMTNELLPRPQYLRYLNQ